MNMCNDVESTVALKAWGWEPLKAESNLVPRACDPLGRKRRLWDNP